MSNCEVNNLPTLVRWSCTVVCWQAKQPALRQRFTAVRRRNWSSTKSVRSCAVRGPPRRPACSQLVVREVPHAPALCEGALTHGGRAGLLHTIIFNRALGPVRPREVDSELFDITYVRGQCCGAPLPALRAARAWWGARRGPARAASRVR